MKVTISSYSIRNEWKDLAEDKIDSLIAICNDMGIDGVELLVSEWTPETLPNIVKKMADNGIEVFGIAVNDNVLVKPNEIEEAIKIGKEHITLAQESGVKYIRYFVGNGPMPPAFHPMDDFDEEEWQDYREQMLDAAEMSMAVLLPILEFAEEKDVYIGLESHGSYSSNYIYMEEVNKRVSSKHFGWIFDIGNYPNDDMRYKALEQVKERTHYLHAKAYEFDEKGFETKLDYPKICKILKDAGFDGIWSIEFEGKMNGLFGVQKLNELIKYSIAKVKGKEYSINLNILSGEELIKYYQNKLNI